MHVYRVRVRGHTGDLPRSAFGRPSLADSTGSCAQAEVRERLQPAAGGGRYGTSSTLTGKRLP